MTELTTMQTLPATTAEYTAAISSKLTERLNPSQLEVIDESAEHAGHVGANAVGFGSHVRVRIASPQFDGISRVAKHRLVYDATQNFIDDGLHALAIDII